MKIASIALLASAALLSACATTSAREPTIAPKVVEVQVFKPCVPADVPQSPGAYADSALSKDTDPADRYRLTAAANQQRKKRLAEIEPVIAGCR